MPSWRSVIWCSAGSDDLGGPVWIRKLRRFGAFERFSHWLTAVSFVILGLTGLNITFGEILLLPVIGPDAFSDLSQAAKYAHNFTSFAFVIGLVLIVANWIKDNIPRKVDIDWIKQGGGFIKSRHAPAGRFNAGEKMVLLAGPLRPEPRWRCPDTCCFSRSTAPISPECRWRRSCTPSSPFSSSP